VLHIYEREKFWGAIAHSAGQTPLKPPAGLQKRTVSTSIGTSPQSIEMQKTASDVRGHARQTENPQPPNGLATNETEALVASKRLGYPVLRASELRAWRSRDADCLFRSELSHYMRFAVEASPERPVLVDKFLEDATEVDVDCIADVGPACKRENRRHDCHWRDAGAHRIRRRAFRDAAMVLPPHTLPKA